MAHPTLLEDPRLIYLTNNASTLLTSIPGFETSEAHLRYPSREASRFQDATLSILVDTGKTTQPIVATFHEKFPGFRDELRTMFGFETAPLVGVRYDEILGIGVGEGNRERGREVLVDERNLFAVLMFLKRCKGRGRLILRSEGAREVRSSEEGRRNLTQKGSMAGVSAERVSGDQGGDGDGRLLMSGGLVGSSRSLANTPRNDTEPPARPTPREAPQHSPNTQPSARAARRRTPGIPWQREDPESACRRRRWWRVQEVIGRRR